MCRACDTRMLWTEPLKAIGRGTNPGMCRLINSLDFGGQKYANEYNRWKEHTKKLAKNKTGTSTHHTRIGCLHKMYDCFIYFLVRNTSRPAVYEWNEPNAWQCTQKVGPHRESFKGGKTIWNIFLMFKYAHVFNAHNVIMVGKKWLSASVTVSAYQQQQRIGAVCFYYLNGICTPTQRICCC